MIGTKVLTTGQVAKLCEVANRTVVDWFNEGILNGFKVPNSTHRRVPIEALEPFLKEHGMWGESGLRQTTLENYVMVVTRQQGVADELLRSGTEALPVEVFNCTMSAGLRVNQGAPRAIVIDSDLHHIAKIISETRPLVHIIVLPHEGSRVSAQLPGYSYPRDLGSVSNYISQLAERLR